MLRFRKEKYLDSERTYVLQGYEDTDSEILYQLHQPPKQYPCQQEPIGDSYWVSSLKKLSSKNTRYDLSSENIIDDEYIKTNHC